MGATDNLIQQATAAATVSVEFEVFGQVQGKINLLLFFPFYLLNGEKVHLDEMQHISFKHIM